MQLQLYGMRARDDTVTKQYSSEPVERERDVSLPE